MSNVFDEIYAEAFTNELVKIAQDNNLDPDAFINHVMEKRANMQGAATAALNFAKKQVASTGASFKNMLDAGAGLGKGVKNKVVEKATDLQKGKGYDYASRIKAKEGFEKMKSALPNAKRALAITGAGTLAAGYGASKI